MKQIKVCYFGTYLENYPRNRMNIRGLALNNVQVIQCHYAKPVFKITSPFSTILAFLAQQASLIQRNLVLFCKALLIYRREKYGVIIVGFPGLLDLPTAFLVAKLTGSKLIFDMFISTYDTFVSDRKMVKKNSILAKMLFTFEKVLLQFPDLILVDTQQNKTYFSQLFAIPKKKLAVLYVGSDYQQPLSPKASKKGLFNIVYAGGFIPLHGVEHIIECAKLCADIKDFQFTFIGEGQLLKQMKELVASYKLKNIRFISWLKEKELMQEIAKASVILGIFQNNAKAARVIPNKVIQGMALKKIVVTAGTPAILELFKDKKDVFLCEAGNARSLKRALITLKKSPKKREVIAKNGYLFFQKNLTTEKIGYSLMKICESLA